MNKRKGKKNNLHDGSNNVNTVIEKKLSEKLEVNQTEQPKQVHKRRIRIELLPNPVLLRVEEVAHYFDVTERTVYLWVQHGHLVKVETPGGQIRITKESVEKCKFRKDN